MQSNNRILTVVGARPQFIKAAVVSKALEAADGLEEMMVHTGQHYDAEMSDAFFDELEIPKPKYFLGIGSGGHGYQTGEMMKRLEAVLVEEKPSMMVVYGDTNSTLAGAIAAAKLHIPIAHVEAGLRSFNKRMPEEINRIMTDHISSLLFCPTEMARSNLAAEGIRIGVFQSGDVMYDVALRFGPVAERKSAILSRLSLKTDQYLLATVHRAENTDSGQRLQHILQSLNELSREIEVVIPLHPRTRKMIRQFGIESLLQGIRTTEPLGFLDMLMLIKNARIVTTDSGGIQKEAYFQRVGCVTLREQTEWTETVNAGWNALAAMDTSATITQSIRNALHGDGKRSDISDYGDGCAAQRIVRAIRRYLQSNSVLSSGNLKDTGTMGSSPHAA